MPRSLLFVPTARSLMACLLFLLVTGCDEEIDPLAGSDRGYTLYGVLSPQLDTQRVRVYPVEDLLSPTEPGSLGVRLVSEDVTTGQTRVWRDSLIQEPDGRYAHVYWAPFQAAYDHTYRITAEDPSGEVSRAEARVPAQSQIVLRSAEQDQSGVTVPAFINADVPRLNTVEATFHIKWDEGPSATTTARVPVSYDDRVQKTEGGWVIPINLSETFSTFRDALREAEAWEPSFGLALLNIQLQLVVANEEWSPPEGVFDPDVIVQPGTMTNVENGFGFIGAGYRLEESWLPADSVRRAAGFTVLQEQGE